jgi:hypothetical protein
LQRYLHAVRVEVFHPLKLYMTVMELQGSNDIVNLVLIGYSLDMQYSKHGLIKRKQPQQQKRTYNENYHLQRFYDDCKNIKLLVYRCDTCNDDLTQVPDNFEERMKIIDEIDASFESDYDKSTYEQGPKLILCDYCKKEYLLPSYK